MKKLFLILSILISLSGYSQTKYEMFSKIWDVNGDTLLPKGDPHWDFSFLSDSVYNEISEEKIRGYLLESCNEFRRDYGLDYDVIEDKELTRDANNHAKKMDKLGHSNFSKTKANGETVGNLRFAMISNYENSMGDINKIIAECYFDIFAMSSPHMSILLDDNKDIEFGFGMSVVNYNVRICIQTYSPYDITEYIK